MSSDETHILLIALFVRVEDDVVNLVVVNVGDGADISLDVRANIRLGITLVSLAVLGLVVLSDMAAAVLALVTTIILLLVDTLLVGTLQLFLGKFVVALLDLGLRLLHLLGNGLPGLAVLLQLQELLVLILSKSEIGLAGAVLLVIGGELDVGLLLISQRLRLRLLIVGSGLGVVLAVGSRLGVVLLVGGLSILSSVGLSLLSSSLGLILSLLSSALGGKARLGDVLTDLALCLLVSGQSDRREPGIDNESEFVKKC